MDGRPAGKHALAFIFITLLIDVMGLGLIVPILPKLIEGLIHEGLDDAARVGAYLAFAYAGMQFLFSPFLGNLSDRFGRKPVLIISLAGICIDYLIMGFAPTIGWLFLGRLLSGIGGASFTTGAAYINDISTPETRARNFGMIGAAFGLGFIVGPAISGIISVYGVRVPFFAAAGLAMANAVYGLLVLKESLPKESRRKFELWRANPLGAFLVLRRYPTVLPLCGVLVLMRLAHDANPNVFSYYTMQMYHWTPRQVGWALAGIGVIVAISYSTLPRLVNRIGENRSVYIGLAGGALSFAGYAFSGNGWMFLAFMLPFGVVSLIMPSLNAIMAREVPPNTQGELQGALTALGSLTSVFAPLMMGNLFAYFSAPEAPVYFPGAAFLAAALCLVLAGILFAIIRPQERAAPSVQGAE